ncbi:HAD family hydrolase [Kyrpidia spormannii]|uniref:HAD family hydrolase n=1 Tax=Kyrpidia spormannii TaxID=2055160 RepID=A0ACA8Z8R7_9BACL|nr:HAD family hydrolase [Kyrpidia spormannii]CAB3391754.1 HAD family hydrolase [Kyrpidia spormannii]
MKKDKEHIIFDLDDTLVHCNVHFLRVRRNFVEQMLSWFGRGGVTGREIWATQSRIDLEQVEKGGLQKDHFPQSLVETYRIFCKRFGRKAEPEEERSLLALGYRVYESPVILYPYARESLEELRDRGYVLYLYTGGDPEVQLRKLEQSGLSRFFDPERRFVTPFKDRVRLGELLHQFDLPAGGAWMVGNSLRSDILPALELGLTAIHVPEEQPWEFDHAVIPESYYSRLHHVSGLQEVPAVIIGERGVAG